MHNTNRENKDSINNKTQTLAPVTPEAEEMEIHPNLNHRELLHQTALKAPKSSGVYMWRNENGTIIYVGKAKNLKSRLTSYFSGTKDIKTRLLIHNARSIEYITTNNEYEAFLLENNLIKKHTPRYNINLKDGKSYPVIRITKEEFPRIFKTRNIVHDGSLYFGPFPDATALDTFLETLYEIYPIRHCKSFKEKTSPCMYYHIGRCLGPCCKDVAKETYSEFIEEIITLLEGKGDIDFSDSGNGKKESASQKIVAMMKDAASKLNFEKAARLRDGLKALSVLTNQNIVENFDENDRDYIASWREGELVSFTVLKIREGKLLGRDNYRTISLNEDSEILPEFMGAFYTDKDSIPPQIYVMASEGMDLVEKWFHETYGSSTKIISVSFINDEEQDVSQNLLPAFEQQANLHMATLNMARQNAHEDIVRRVRERGDFPAMEELQKVLGLPKLPQRIEGFDIAHIGGKFPVASLISFWNGNPDKKNYRYFRLRTTDGYIDDFESMREAVTRRYSRLQNEKKPMPDLILIDGGIGQVNAVNGVLEALGLSIPIAGLAKRDEEIYRPNNSTPINLPKRSDGLRLLQRVRDETHRFATSRNQELRTKENTISPFLSLPGVGKEKDKILMKEYGTLECLSKSSESKVAQLLHMRADAASALLMEARRLYGEQLKKKQFQELSLDIAGTTKQKAARLKQNSNLAASALLEDEDDMLEVAEPEISDFYDDSGMTDEDDQYQQQD